MFAITENVATLGGGVAVDGDTNIIDTAIYANIGENGADDVRVATRIPFSMSYTESMDSAYTENQPVGFYKDYMGSRFDASTNALFIGEVIDCEIDSPDFGAKFVFASDLPQEPEQPEPPEETPPAPPTSRSFWTPPFCADHDPASCNGFFRRNDNLTYGQLIAILTRFVDAKTAPMPDVSYAEHWAHKNIMTAVAYGWIQDAASV